MAKINHVILEYRDVLSQTGITPETKPPKAVLRRFVRVFSHAEDHRVDSMIDYPLVEILLIAFLAVLANASTWSEIAQFGEEKQQWLRKFLRLKHGVPSHDTFRRVFSLIDPDTLQKATVDFLTENMAALRRSVGIPDDGYAWSAWMEKKKRALAGNMAQQRQSGTCRPCMSTMPQTPSV